MNTRLKILTALAAIVTAGAAISYLSGQSSSSGQTGRTQNQIKGLPKGKEGKDPISACMPPETISEGEIIKVGPYSLYRFTYITKEHSHVVEVKHRHKGNDRDLAVEIPNVDVAVLKQNPLEGCEKIAASLITNKLPDTIPLKQRIAIRKAFWIVRLEAVQEFMKMPGERWVKHGLNNPGIPGIHFLPLDLKALKEIGIAMPKWYNPDISQEERDKLIMAERMRAGEEDYQHYLNKTGPYAPK